MEKRGVFSLSPLPGCSVLRAAKFCCRFGFVSVLVEVIFLLPVSQLLPQGAVRWSRSYLEVPG